MKEEQKDRDFFIVATCELLTRSESWQSSTSLNTVQILTYVRILTIKNI